MEPPKSIFTDEELNSDATSKKSILSFILDNATLEFLKENGINGKLANVAKTASKDKAIQCYKALFESGKFRDPNEPLVTEVKATETQDKTQEKSKTEAAAEVKYFTKTVLKKGDKMTFPRKGSTVHCWYTGSLEDGTIFDSNQGHGGFKKLRQPLAFKIGANKVITGWEQGVLTMSKGEKCVLKIQAEGAYGKAGQPQAKIPPNANLSFEVELANIS